MMPCLTPVGQGKQGFVLQLARCHTDLFDAGTWLAELTVATRDGVQARGPHRSDETRRFGNIDEPPARDTAHAPAA
ncbi:hypothetical protein [Rhodopirellula sallentina]|uniref:Uncharacterized protein n=1 Tax=Rhodopirellula sallentina SM41 TaxID=1263870 RepID=M5U617_9BACT|nr:hypothetical protein [Rhodopirellula sallentina]EMI53296.1 hypothetical protein RSSM_05269 [Rhodopirellula sallentina SM41]